MRQLTRAIVVSSSDARTLMQSRYNFADPATAPADVHRLKFVIKRPDGFRKASSSFSGPVKYMLEDEIVDDVGQRSGLRKTKV